MGKTTELDWYYFEVKERFPNFEKKHKIEDFYFLIYYIGRLHLNYIFSSSYIIIGEKTLKFGKILAKIKKNKKNAIKPVKPPKITELGFFNPGFCQP